MRAERLDCLLWAKNQSLWLREITYTRNNLRSYKAAMGLANHDLQNQSIIEHIIGLDDTLKSLAVANCMDAIYLWGMTLCQNNYLRCLSFRNLLEGPFLLKIFYTGSWRQLAVTMTGPTVVAFSSTPTRPSWFGAMRRTISDWSLCRREET